MSKSQLLTGLFLVFAVVGCSERRDSEVDLQAIERGKALFGVNCGQCHPRSGRGDYLKRIPATLLTRQSEEELMRWILGGSRHREMPNFENLSESQRRDLSIYLRSQIDK